MSSINNPTGVKVEDGNVIGAVRTNIVGSDCNFVICGIEEWNKMTEEEQDKALIEAAHESGMFEIYLPKER